MTRREQLIIFVLGLATVSVCTVAFALAMSLVRQMAVSASAEDSVAAARAEAEEKLAWQMPPTPTALVPPGQAGTSTVTREPTPTNTRVPTWTPSPTYTPTATRVPTDTPVPTPTPTRVPAEVVSAPAPAAAAPAPTPTPEFPYDTMVRVFDTGTPQMTRITGMVWKVVNVNTAEYEGEAGFQMRMVDPNGGVRLSDVSGLGGADSTCRDCGDNQTMNMKIEFRPYLPGAYRVKLVQGEKQMAKEVEFTLAANPSQYVHVNFIPWK
jgi:hypothetical protein